MQSSRVFRNKTSHGQQCCQGGGGRKITPWPNQLANNSGKAPKRCVRNWKQKGHKNYNGR